MTTLTVHMAPIGTPLANGTLSTVGRMWYTLDDGSGSLPFSFGFAPLKGATGINRAFGPGEPHKNDNTQYLNTDPSKPIGTRTIEISQAEYNTLKSFGENPSAYGFSTFYNGLSNSCVDFAWKAMQAAGLNNAQIQGAMLPQWNKDYVQYAWDELQRTKLTDWTADISIDETGRVTVNPICRPGQFRFVDPTVNTATTAARNYVIPRRDPLVLDLDGDGLELLAATGAVLFDHNADGIKTGTGWVRPDDGLLVRDLDGNGVIDSGRELFGIDTLKANNALAANGFDALKELDSNADGFITSLDTAYAELKVWRDINQDGISQTGELQTLAQSGVQSINLISTASSTSYANGNATLVQTGSFTRTDGSAGQAGSFSLAHNFVSAFMPMALSDVVKVTACKVAIKSIAGCTCRISAKGGFDANDRMHKRRGPIGAFSKAEHRIGIAAKAFKGNGRADAMLVKV